GGWLLRGYEREVITYHPGNRTTPGPARRSAVRSGRRPDQRGPQSASLAAAGWPNVDPGTPAGTPRAKKLSSKLPVPAASGSMSNTLPTQLLWVKSPAPP